MKYSDLVLNHFFHPQNVGTFVDSEQDVGRSRVGCYENGALIHFQVKRAGGEIVAAKFKAYGNCIIIAACSFATQWLEGKLLSVVNDFTSTIIVTELSVPDTKIHCALLVEDAVQLAIANLPTRLDEEVEA